MKINTYFIQLASTIIVIFGGTFTIRYFRAGELLLDQLIGAMVGILLLMATIIWKKYLLSKPLLKWTIKYVYFSEAASYELVGLAVFENEKPFGFENGFFFYVKN